MQTGPFLEARPGNSGAIKPMSKAQKITKWLDLKMVA